MTSAATAMSVSVMNTYGRFPLSIVRGKGSYVWNEKEEKYLDFTSGIATCNLGHTPDYVRDQLKVQLDQLWHCSNLYDIPLQTELANLLTANSFADRVFFCNSGAEANEAAIKLARRYAKKVKNKNAFEVVTFTKSFHGRTLATLSATGQQKIQEGFEPLMPGFRYLPYNDLEVLNELVLPNTCAVMLELVQGEGGVIPADQEWVNTLVTLCRQHDVLIIIDEIQTGMGRTGSLFAYEQYGFEPDIISLAKGLGSGFPIGAMLATEEVAQAFTPGSHGSTFGGNPLAVSAGLATFQYFIKENVVELSKSNGQYLQEKLLSLKEKHPAILSVRGKGLLIGLLMDGAALDIVNAARNRHLLVLTAGPDVLRILPPLTVTKNEIDECISILDDTLTAMTC